MIKDTVIYQAYTDCDLNNYWTKTPYETYFTIGAKSKGTVGETIVKNYLESVGFIIKPRENAGHDAIVNGIKNLNISNNALTIDMLLSIMINNCSQSQKKDYGLFVNGVSFTNLKNNAVLNADYIFILNCNDNVLDNSEKRSELDLRVQQDINQQRIKQ